MSSGGIAIAAGLTASELFSMSVVRVVASDSATANTPGASTAGPWRPPQWSQPALYMITVPGAYSTVLGASTASSLVGTPASQNAASGGGASGNGVFTLTQTVSATTAPVTQPPTYLVFDGVLRSSHSQEARPTQYPVQTQANFTDHVLLEPARLTLDIVMSDAMQDYATGQWVGNPSKSVSCFQVLDSLRAARVPLTVSTRLKVYSNMVLTNVVPDESVRTLHGLRARVEFQQVFIATVSTTTQQGVSARQQTTDNTTLGPTNPTSVPNGVQSQNGLPSTATGAESSAQLQQQTGAVVGAGNWSSNNASDLSDLF